ncbi:ferredoxin-NADP reductase [Propionibacteriaceae bacterium ES.041]|uniref:PDR/VanB family oxidoreductase n=1 Tax=Enemella evansiae TaxID=2016499 RepID=UPI000B96F381|nr:PDR/VanB family oxidoreductase [Enemella evansiae]OYN98610.1 oxidoreductase [Enemella evansiae]PFG65691.1 ferredoxin-NADP reductase [Propionibacteriaceae bacterium ES.041]
MANAAAAVLPQTSPQTEFLVLRERRQEADGVVSLVFGRADGGRLPDWAPGAHIDLHLPSGHTRQYSLCGDRWDPTSYRVAVLRETAGGGGSAYVHDQLRVGDQVGVGGPRNNFALVPAAAYRFIAGGIGITPILPMIDQAERLGIDWQLLYGGRSRASMAFAAELTERYGERVRLHPQDEHGLLPLADFLGADPAATVYACGPGPLLAALREATADRPPGRVRTERFVAANPAVPVRAESFEICLARSGRALTVTPERTILQTLQSNGVAVVSSCAQGLCGTCETGVLEGIPDHRDSLLDDEEQARGDCMFVCVSRSAGPRLVLDV